MEVGAGVTINPIAFLVITTENVRLIPVNHSSSLDRLIDYMPDLIEKTNQMMNKCIQKDEGHVNLTLSSAKEYPLLPGEKLIYNKESDQCRINPPGN